MALVGISKTDTFDYVSDKDPCKRVVPLLKDATGNVVALSEDTPTETIIDPGASHFTLGVLDVFLMGMIYDNSTKLTRGIENVSEVTFATLINATNIETVRFGLKGWTHFTDEKGNDLEFKSEQRLISGRKYPACTDATLQSLGIQLIGELAQQIKQASEVSKVEAKNSAAAS